MGSGDRLAHPDRKALLGEATGIRPRPDVLGVSMLVDTINHRRPSAATPNTVEGPFHVPNAPAMADGGNMAQGAPGIPCFVTGKVHGLDGEPIAGAVLDLWQTDGEGLYEDQRDG